MIRNEEKYQKARDFRKRGFSYTEIAKIVGVSRGTLSNWLGNQTFSKKVRQDNEIKARKDNVKRISLLNKAKQNERDKRVKETLRGALIEFKHYQRLPHFMAGLMLYTGSGDVLDPKVVRLSDSRPEIHRMFVKFATDFLGVDKSNIHCWLAVPKGVSEAKSVAEWSKILKVPHSQFYKSQQLSPTDRALRKTVGNTIIGDTLLKQKLQKWIELATRELSR
jgi:transcriptional regulator with XRE-family HTH domain